MKLSKKGKTWHNPCAKCVLHANRNMVWQIPGSNSKSNGFTNAEAGTGTTGLIT
jgi:hypothetical protein